MKLRNNVDVFDTRITVRIKLNELLHSFFLRFIQFYTSVYCLVFLKCEEKIRWLQIH